MGTWDSGGGASQPQRLGDGSHSQMDQHESASATTWRDFGQSVLLSAVSSDAQIFTHAHHPFKIVSVNSAWTRLCGYASTEVLGLTCKILQTPQTSLDVLQELHGAIRAQREVTVQLLNCTKSRSVFVNELTVSPLCDGNGRVTHMMGTLRRIEGAQLPVVSFPRQSLSLAALGVQPSSQCPVQDAPFSSREGQLLAASGKRLLESGQSNEPPKERADMLLSRNSFPLHTLNNHPVAPVLLRMLQLNSSANRSPNVQQSGEGGASEMAGHSNLDSHSSLRSGMTLMSHQERSHSSDPNGNEKTLKSQGECGESSGSALQPDSSTYARTIDPSASSESRVSTSFCSRQTLGQAPRSFIEAGVCTHDPIIFRVHFVGSFPQLYSKHAFKTRDSPHAFASVSREPLACVPEMRMFSPTLHRAFSFSLLQLFDRVSYPLILGPSLLMTLRLWREVTATRLRTLLLGDDLSDAGPRWIGSMGMERNSNGNQTCLQRSSSTSCSRSCVLRRRSSSLMNCSSNL